VIAQLKSLAKRTRKQPQVELAVVKPCVGFLASTRKSHRKKKHFKAMGVGLGGQTVKILRRFGCKFDLDESIFSLDLTGCDPFSQ